MQSPASPARNYNHSPSRGVTPSSSSSNVDVNTAALSPAAAALQGATHAFNRQKPGGGKSNSNNNNMNNSWAAAALSGTGQNWNQIQTGSKVAGAVQPRTGREINSGALLAATQAASVSASRSRSRPESVVGTEAGAAPGTVSRHVTGGREDVCASGSVHEVGIGAGEQDRSLVAQRLSQYLHASPGGASSGGNRNTPPPVLLSAPGGSGNGAGKQASASFIAATLAASRSASPIRSLSTQPHLNGGGGRRQSVGAISIATSSSLEPGRVAAEVDVPDTASIQPTTSLVSLFERKKDEDVDPVKRKAASTGSGTPVLNRESRTGAEKQGQKTKPKLKPKPKPKPKPKAPGNRNSTAQEIDQKENAHRGDYNDGKSGPQRGLLPAIRPQDPNRQQAAAETQGSLADRRPSTPQPSRAAESPTHVSPRPMGLVRTPRLEPPTPPVRASGTIKMTDPTVKVSPMKPENDQVNALRNHHARPATSRRLSQSSASSDDTFVSASSVQSPRRMSPARGPDQPAPRAAPRVVTAHLPQTSTASRASTPNLPLDSLTDAIVASNLASTRLTATTTSSHGPPPVPAPRRHGRNDNHDSLMPVPLQPQRTGESFHSQLTSSSRSPNRQQQQHTGGKLRQTLRAPPSSLSDDDEEDAQRRRRRAAHEGRRARVKTKVLGGQRRHAHHEGSRRRWGDEVMARERRRYEAVWASNKGLFMQPGFAVGYGDDRDPAAAGGGVDVGRAWAGPEAEMVANVVVRDIWARSRLPADELAEVWDLVYARGQGQGGQSGRPQKALARDEFVVGMWLIDQRLRGRKIPAKVSRSVWESVGAAVVVPSPGRKKKG
ncbi:Increased rDNA silencing protein 4 [Madurella mycetomatis]|uniref:Increased rDNA silencing protein 4 n=1 Tax=Madurella mycetomatis TaxID=100816 RepID=A0A175W5F5_9PEZI|nr:Increased rDNA silencing protein 4 [Madurella mycetomatis]